MTPPAEISLKTKIEALRVLPDQVRKNPDDAVNRLFFAARNGAISHVLREFEHHFQDQGFQVRAAWKETSFPGVIIALTLHDKRTGRTDRHIHVTRDSVIPPTEMVSTLAYTLKSIDAGAYYGGRKPKVAEDFDTILGSEEFKTLATGLVNGVNYPFTYASHSSF